MICTCLRCLWPCIRRKFTIQISKFLSLPSAIEDIASNPKKLKIALKYYLLTQSFYNLDDFFFSKQ